LADDIHMFSHSELVTQLIKAKGIHQGFWMLVVTYGFGAANVGENDKVLNPTAFVPITGIGIRSVPSAENNLTVDAAAANPKRE
jgi:hypothetical protein